MLFPVACGPTNTVTSPNRISASVTGPILVALIRSTILRQPSIHLIRFTTIAIGALSCQKNWHSASRGQPRSSNFPFEGSIIGPANEAMLGKPFPARTAGRWPSVHRTLERLTRPEGHRVRCAHGDGSPQFGPQVRTLSPCPALSRYRPSRRSRPPASSSTASNAERRFPATFRRADQRPFPRRAESGALRSPYGLPAHSRILYFFLWTS